MAKYPFETIEPKWQQYWAAHKTFTTTEDAAFPKEKRCYVLDMFPYPSAQGLHVGHPEGYTATDIYCRYLRLNGYNVLHPMGFDSFGLPAENYAIKTGTHPAVTTAANIERFRVQIKALGFSYDWDREVDTSSEDYYRWTQWIFLKLFEKGLAYEAESPINWCPSCKTGLANEEVKDGLCDRCGEKVTRKRIRQWILKITAYAERLLADLDGLDWPEPVKLMQRNWIGRSEGANVVFKVFREKGLGTGDWGLGEELSIEIYTTRPDTLFGATYMVLSPEHPLVEKITTPEQKDAVDAYIAAAALKSDLERTDLAKGKTGVWSGAYAINPVNDQKIPIWIADYVLISYGTGAIMAVPAHDERDWEFAKEYNLPIIQVVTEKKGLGTGDWGLGKEKDDGENIQRFDSMARGNESCRDDLPADEKFSERGNVRADQPNQAGCGVNSSQYSGRQWTKEPEGVHSVSVNSERFNDRTGNSSDDCGTAQIYDERNIRTTTDEAAISRSLTDRPEEIPDPQSLVPSPQSPFTGDGYSINSGLITGLPTAEAKKKITAWLEEKGIGNKAVNYKLRDWIFSRQRYWGEPIPVVHCSKCGIVPLPESELPLKLPNVTSYAPTGTGESPLAGINEWVHTKCPQCGGPAKRETNTMPQWAGSCWYYLRYLDPKNDKEFVSKEKIDYWMPVDLYVGGAEHAVLHLLYSRFWHKVLYDCGLVNTVEPFQRLINQGMILGEDNQKMSKSRGNVINPDDIIKSYGADAMRVYEMFMGPLEVSKPWITSGLVGVSRFLERIWGIGTRDCCSQSERDDKQLGFQTTLPSPQSPVPSPQTPQSLEKLLHKTIKKVTDDTASINFNTAISAMMIYSNELGKLAVIPPALWEPLVIMLSVYAPHLGEELWEKLGHTTSVSACAWPSYDEALTHDDTVTVMIQINGKIRDKFTAAAGTATADLEKTALALPGVQKWLEGQTVAKVITVPDKLVNIVLRPT